MVNGIIRPPKRKIRVEKTYLVTFSGRYSEIILVVFESRRLSRQAGLTGDQPAGRTAGLCNSRCLACRSIMRSTIVLRPLARRTSGGSSLLNFSALRESCNGGSGFADPFPCRRKL
jgi:hypothetical protein